jgi:hypothetical protein
MSLIGGKSS